MNRWHKIKCGLCSAESGDTVDPSTQHLQGRALEFYILDDLEYENGATIRCEFCVPDEDEKL